MAWRSAASGATDPASCTSGAGVGRRTRLDDRQPGRHGAPFAPRLRLRAMPLAGIIPRRPARPLGIRLSSRSAARGVRGRDDRVGRSGRPPSRGRTRRADAAEPLLPGERGRARCISCHDPHRLPDPGERVGYYRGRCLECHSERGCTLPPDQRRRGIRPTTARPVTCRRRAPPTLPTRPSRSTRSRVTARRRPENFRKLSGQSPRPPAAWLRRGHEPVVVRQARVAGFLVRVGQERVGRA